MRKQEFLAELQTRLSGLSRQELDERLGFYSEMIDDRMEEGLSEEEAVAATGGTDEVAAQILAEYPLSKNGEGTGRQKRRLRVWEIVLLVLGSPIWLSLLIAAFAVALSLYIVLWSLVIVLWAVMLAFVACAVYGFVMAAVFFMQGNIPAGLALTGMGICCIGCAILMIFGSKAATKGAAILTKKLFLGMRAKLSRRERSR